MIAAIGPRGEGKSHWLHQQIRDELKATRRRVFTNSATINFAKMSEQTEIPEPELRELLTIIPQDVWRDRTIWPVWEPDHTVVQEGIFPPGCLIVIDECHFFLGSELPSVPVEFTRFHDMSRHMTDAAGVPIDMFVAAQYRTSFHKEVKRRIEYVYEFKNLDANGITKGLGAVAKFRSADNYRKNFINEEKYLRDKSVYELYESTASGGGSKIAAQASSGKFVRRYVLVAAVAVLFGIGALGYVVVSFTKLSHGDKLMAAKPASASKPASGAAGLAQASAGAVGASKSCSGAFYSSPSGVFLLTSDGKLTDVSILVKQDAFWCVLDVAGCHWSYRGTCADGRPG